MVAENDSKKDTFQTSVQTKKYRVMIVDDEQDITAIFKIGLEKNQFIVTTFNDPLEALSKFRPRLYDLLILDTRMPGMNGFQLYEKIRALDDNVRVCFLTAFEESRRVQEFVSFFRGSKLLPQKANYTPRFDKTPCRCSKFKDLVATFLTALLSAYWASMLTELTSHIASTLRNAHSSKVSFNFLLHPAMHLKFRDLTTSARTQERILAKTYLESVIANYQYVQ